MSSMPFQQYFPAKPPASPSMRRESTPPLPYLGRHALLSLSVFSQSLLSILLVSLPLCLLLFHTLPSTTEDATVSFASSCQTMEVAAGVAVNFPYYMAQGVNQGNKAAVEAVVRGTADVLDGGLVAIEEIVIFIVDTYRSLFLCLLDLAVHGSLTLLVDLTQEAESFIEGAFQDVRLDIQNSVGIINQGLSTSVGLIDKLPGVNLQAPQISMPALTSLSNTTIPSSLIQGLTWLNGSLPTLDEFQAVMDSVITNPIDDLRTKVAASMANATIDVQLLPVPDQQLLSFCDELDTTFIDDLARSLATFAKVALTCLGLCAAIILIFNLLWERRRYKAYLLSIERARLSMLSNLDKQLKPEETLSVVNLQSFLSATHHPVQHQCITWLGRKMKLTQDQRNSIHWFGAYILHATPLLFFTVGFLGLIMVQVQLYVLEGPLRSSIQSQANQGSIDFTSKIQQILNNNLNETSTLYAQKSNEVIGSLNNGINDELFGWVNTTTSSLNTTISTFYNEITTVISDVFNGTVLENPALDMVYCLIGRKVNALENAFTWIHDHSYIALPNVSSDVFALSPNSTAQLASGVSGSRNSTVPDGSSIADKMITTYARNLERQRLGFLLCVAVWILYVFWGLMGIGWTIYKRRGSRHRFFGAPFKEKGSPRLRPFHLQRSVNAKVARRSYDSNRVSITKKNVSEKHGVSSSHRSEVSNSWGSLLAFFKKPEEHLISGEMWQLSSDDSKHDQIKEELADMAPATTSIVMAKHEQTMSDFSSSHQAGASKDDNSVRRTLRDTLRRLSGITAGKWEAFKTGDYSRFDQVYPDLASSSASVKVQPNTPHSDLLEMKSEQEPMNPFTDPSSTENHFVGVLIPPQHSLSPVASHPELTSQQWSETSHSPQYIMPSYPNTCASRQRSMGWEDHQARRPVNPFASPFDSIEEE